MPRTTRSTRRALGPAVTRLPPKVLTLIFSHNADFRPVPEFYPELMYGWSIRSGLGFLSVASRVCRAWTGPAQGLLVKSVGLIKRERLEGAVAEGGLLERYPVETLSIAARGKKANKITGAQAEEVLDKVTGVTSLLLKAITGLTTNALFAPELAKNLTYLNLQAAVHLPPKKVTSLACPSSIPLKTLILGSDAQPAEFLRQLFTAAAATLTRLDLYISNSTTPSLIQTFPILAPDLTQLSLTGGSTSGSLFGWGHSPADQTQFLVLLSHCDRLRVFGWSDDGVGRLGSVLARLPDQGGRIEALRLSGYLGYGSEQARLFTALVLERAGLCSLRTVVEAADGSVASEIEQACRKRRIVFVRER